MTIKLKQNKFLYWILIFTFSIILFSTQIAHAKTSEKLKTIFKEDHLIVHFLDIGQADCILIQDSKGHNILVDAGNDKDTNYIQGYLLSLGVRKIDVLIATHPHEDHIGSMDDIVYTFDIEKIYAPKVEYNTSYNRRFLDAVHKKGYEIIYANAGKRLRLGGVKIQILSPSKIIYDDLNLNSLVFKLTFGDISFLFMGDAEGNVLNEIMRSGYNLESDVIKIGHHGSIASSPIDFIKAVDPKIALISTREHSYSYPHFATTSTLSRNHVETHVTSGGGTIVISTDGKHINVMRSLYKNTDKKSLVK